MPPRYTLPGASALRRWGRSSSVRSSCSMRSPHRAVGARIPTRYSFQRSTRSGRRWRASTGGQACEAGPLVGSASPRHVLEADTIAVMVLLPRTASGSIRFGPPKLSDKRRRKWTVLECCDAARSSRTPVRMRSLARRPALRHLVPCGHGPVRIMLMPLLRICAEVRFHTTIRLRRVLPLHVARHVGPTMSGLLSTKVWVAPTTGRLRRLRRTPSSRCDTARSACRHPERACGRCVPPPATMAFHAADQGILRDRVGAFRARRSALADSVQSSRRGGGPAANRFPRTSELGVSRGRTMILRSIRAPSMALRQPVDPVGGSDIRDQRAGSIVRRRIPDASLDDGRG